MNNPVEILGNGKVEEFGASGWLQRIRQSAAAGYPVEAASLTWNATFIAAIGQNPESDGFVGTGLNVRRTHAVDPRTMATDIPGVLPGDCVTGPAAVVEAIDGKENTAAFQYLGGTADVVPKSSTHAS